MTYTLLPDYSTDRISVGVVTTVTQPGFQQYSYVVAVAQPTLSCDSCGQDFPIYSACDVIGIGNFGRVQHYSRQHGCGQWAPVVMQYIELPVEPGVDSLKTVATSLVNAVAEELEAEMALIRGQVTTKLKSQLADWLDHLPDCEVHGQHDPDGYCPYAGEEGSDTKPGIVQGEAEFTLGFDRYDGLGQPLGSSSGWEAWGHDPTDLTGQNFIVVKDR